jgi:rod shape-determining protein MreC
LGAALAVGLIVLILIALNLLGWLRPLLSGIGIVTEPLTRGVRIVAERTGGALSLLGRIGDLDAENKDLRAKLEESSARIAQLEENASLLADLSERLDAPLPPDVKTITGGIIAHDSVTGTKRLTINRGSNDGVGEGMAVLSAGGTLIGIVQRVTAGQAEILLLADDASRVPVRLAESRTDGILRGELGLGLKLTDLPQSEPIEVGEQIVTSGLGGQLPKGLPIGTVETVESAANALFQVARVRPYTEITQLEYVHVVTAF